MRLVFRSVVVFVALAAAALPSQATIISETITASVSNFIVTGLAVTPPVDPATIKFSITFDNSAGLENQTIGLTLVSSNLPLDSGFGFTYRDGTDRLAVGGLAFNVVGGIAGTNDFGWAFSGISTATPTIFDVFYTSTLAPLSLFDSQTGTVSATPLVTAIAEPATSVLVAAGLGGLVVRRRKAIPM